MSYRRKKLLALFCATALSMTAVAAVQGQRAVLAMLFPRKQKQMQKKHQHRVKQNFFKCRYVY